MDQNYWRLTREDICKQVKEMPAESDDFDNDLQLPMKKFSLVFDLPKCLDTCRQSNERDKWIQMKHLACYRIILHNPDGHPSELKAHHTIYLFISPNLPIGDNDCVERHMTIEHATNITAQETAVPPIYGEHMFDVPVDPFSGLATTAAPTPALRSGAATPGHSLGQAPLMPLPEDLSDRLERVRTEAERQTEESGTHAEYILRSDFNIDALSRVPSYTTAVRTPGPSIDRSTITPSYAVATSRPPSPGPSTTL